MKKNTLVLLASFVIFLTGYSGALAQYYGQGEEQTQIIVDKKVRSAEMDYFVDNLSYSQVKFFEGDMVEYQIEISNKGSSEAENVKVTDQLPSYESLVFGPSELDDGKINWTIEKLAVNETKKYTIRTRINGMPTGNGNCFQLTNRVNTDQDSDNASIFACPSTTPKTGGMGLGLGSTMVGLGLSLAMIVRKKIRGF